VLVLSGTHRADECEYDVVHVNAELADEAADHDPQVARLDLTGRPRP
jgi:hypothetical protein